MDITALADVSKTHVNAEWLSLDNRQFLEQPGKDPGMLSETIRRGRPQDPTRFFP